MKNLRTTPAASVAIIVMSTAMVALLAFRFWPEEKMVVQKAPGTDVAVMPPTAKLFSAVEISAALPVEKKSETDTASFIVRLRACLAETDPERQAQLEEELESLLTAANAAEILRALPQDLLATQFTEAALRRWVKTDRRGASDWVAQQSGLTEPEQTSVIYGWGASDKKSLDDYLDNLPAGEWKQSTMKFAANDALAGERPKDAIDLLLKMEHTPTRDNLLNWSATAWAQSDPAASLKWANDLQDANGKQSALGAVAVGLAWSDPVAAGKLLAEQVQPGEILDRSALGVVCVWAQTDAEAAANWVEQFPEGKLQQNVLETLIQRWSARDLVASKKWVYDLPVGELRDAAVKFYSEAAANLQREPGQELSAQ